MTGDIISDYAWDGSQGWTEKQWKKWTTPLEKKNLNYMYLFGNHDTEQDLSRDMVALMDSKNDLSLTEVGPENIDGTTNYFHPVYDKDGKKKLFYVWIFDTQVENCNGVPGWGCVNTNQIDWFLENSKKNK